MRAWAKKIIKYELLPYFLYSWWTLTRNGKKKRKVIWIIALSWLPLMYNIKHKSARAQKREIKYDL